MLEKKLEGGIHTFWQTAFCVLKALWMVPRCRFFFEEPEEKRALPFSCVRVWPQATTRMWMLCPPPKKSRMTRRGSCKNFKLGKSEGGQNQEKMIQKQEQNVVHGFFISTAAPLFGWQRFFWLLFLYCLGSGNQSGGPAQTKKHVIFVVGKFFFVLKNNNAKTYVPICGTLSLAPKAAGRKQLRFWATGFGRKNIEGKKTHVRAPLKKTQAVPGQTRAFRAGP